MNKKDEASIRFSFPKYMIELLHTDSINNIRVVRVVLSIISNQGDYSEFHFYQKSFKTPQPWGIGRSVLKRYMTTDQTVVALGTSGLNF